MRTALEGLWNVTTWGDAATVARVIAQAVSIFMAAHYLAALGVPLAVARLVLLGV